ncbi:MAG: HD domain-containing protein [Archaeoglobaceae archaeon]
MLRVDPITLEVLRSNYAAFQRIKQVLLNSKRRFEGLKEFNNWLLDAMSEFYDLPADTRFPGFFSSLYDHALLSSAIAVAIALDLKRKGIDFSAEYNGKISEMLKDEKGLVEVVRCASLLHDIGKHPPEGHYKRTRESAEELLKNAGFEEVAKDIAECASRHHYRESLDDEYKPKTKLEWVVALADKVSVVDRAILIERNEESALCCEWLLSKLNQVLSEDDKRNLGELIDYLKGKRDKVSEIRIIPVDVEKIQQEIDRIVFNPKEVFGVEPKIGLLCLETAGIQKFVTASDFRKYVSGASSLLENVLIEVRDYLKDTFCPECVIYAKGGSLLAIVPASYYRELKNEINRKFKGRTRVASPKIPPKEFFEYGLNELKYGPQVLQESNLVHKRNFGSCVSRTLCFLEAEEIFGETVSIPVGEICRCCYEYPSTQIWKEFDEEFQICERCKIILEEQKRTREALLFYLDLESQKIEPRPENEFWKKLTKKLEDRVKNANVLSELYYKGVKGITFKLVETWDYLGRQHFSPTGEDNEGNYDIAFIKGDGDNFGKIKESASSPAIFREISELFEKVIEDSIVEGFIEILLKEMEILGVIVGEKSEKSKYQLEIPFDVVFIGGDDFLVLMDSAFVFIFLKKFRESVQKLLGERKERYEKEDNQRLSIFPLGVSMGVVICKNRIPIKSTIDVINEMVKKAKEKSKEEATLKKFGSEIYIYLQKFNQIPTKGEIEALERKPEQKSCEEGSESHEKFTSFPMNGKEFICYMEHLKFFVEKGISPNWIKRVFGKEKPRSITDACINLLFKMARTDKESDEFKALERLYEIHEKFEIKDKFSYKHLDIAESVRVLTEKIEKNVRDENLRKKIKKILLGD